MRRSCSAASIIVAGLLVAAVRPTPQTEARPAPPITADRIAAVGDFVSRNRPRLGLPAVAVGIATPDSVLLAEGFGPVTAYTPFWIGSVTKTLTAALAAELAARGVIDLDATVERYLPEFSMQDPFVPRSITLRHLLTHRSGLSQWSGHDARAQREGVFDHLAPRGPPGERAEYSSLNFIILGRVLEGATGRPYDRLLGETLLEPPLQGLVPGHQSWFGVQRRTAEPTPPRFLTPAGFALASARDMARYGGMLLGHGTFAGTPILDSAAAPNCSAPSTSPVGRWLGGGAGRARSWFSVTAGTRGPRARGCDCSPAGGMRSSSWPARTPAPSSTPATRFATGGCWTWSAGSWWCSAGSWWCSACPGSWASR